MRFPVAFLLLIPTLFASEPLPEVNPDALRAHIEFLADDLLQGRDAGSDTYRIAASYVAAHFKQFGLQPAGDKDAYFQTVNFKRRKMNMDTAVCNYHRDGQVIEFKAGEGFTSRGPRKTEQASVRAPLVFVGYGISAPRFGYDDYADLDVKGKIVVMLHGAPGKLKGDVEAHFNDTSEKLAAADRHGAVGAVMISRREGFRSFKRVAGYFNRSPRLNWVYPDGRADADYQSLDCNAYINIDQAAPLFEGAAKSLEAVLADKDNDQLSGFPLKGELEMAMENQIDPMQCVNVAAKLEGSDPNLKDEVLVFSAHLDHVGVSKHKTEGDTIYNGALDNASGIATLIEMARAFATGAHRPKRTLLFLAVTAEERGLLGADYFVHNPTVPIQSIIANVNLDMPLILYPFADVIAFGAEHSSLATPVAKACERLGLVSSPDPFPEEGLFTRSDHYQFVKKGIPAVYILPGLKTNKEGIDPKAIVDDFRENHYHEPSDEATLPIDYEAGRLFTEVNYLISLEIANAPKPPTWNKGSFFGDVFGKKKDH